MVLRILPVLLLTLILSDLYLYFRFMHKRHRPQWAKVLFFLPNSLLLAAALLLTATESHTQANMTQMVIFFSLYLLIALPKMLFLIVDLIGKGICLFFPKGRKISTAVSTLASTLLFLVMGTGLLFGPDWFRVRQADFASSDLPVAFDGYRIVQISDMHLTSFHGRSDDLRHLVRLIEEQHPDMIVFTGDLVSTDVDEMNGFDGILSGLHAPDGVYSIMGNHDYLTYARYLTPKEQAAHRKELMQRQRAMGWDLLLNEHRIIRRGADSIAIIGVENDGKPPFPERGDLQKALHPLPGYKPVKDEHRMFKVLLSHDPSHWRRKVLPETDIQLTLSGHTHGMQFILFGWSPAQHFYPEWKHMYSENGRALYVSLGIGEALIPFRFGAWPEINVITLHRK